jgi:hypothetical protein
MSVGQYVTDCRLLFPRDGEVVMVFVPLRRTLTRPGRPAISTRRPTTQAELNG